MKKPKKLRKGPSGAKPAPGQKAAPAPIKEDFDDGRMDFGGLPDRDLKKNLGGCG
ncbi:MAG: hypothetical protein M3Y60_09325 [Bacteroidota bacterium]|nr:hypothetical protein [Bacteroidota bacterium]